MPVFKTAEEYVAFRVFKQTLTCLDVNTYQVVDRFVEDGQRIVGEFSTAEEADELRDTIRRKRLAEVKESR